MTVARRLVADDRPVVAYALAGFGVFLMAFGGVEFTRGAGRIAAIWGANAFLLVVMLGVAKRHLLGVSLAGLAGFAVANVLAGDDPLISLALPSANLVEVTICYSGLRWFGDHDLTRPRTLLAFSGFAMVPATLFSSAIAALTFRIVHGADFGTLFWNWYAADALGLITFTPLFASIAHRWAGPSQRFDGRRALHALLASVTFAAVLGAIFLQNSYPLLFLVYPALVAVAFRYGFFGASVALVVTALVALVSTAQGLGPLSLVHGSLREKVLILQIFVAVSAAMSLATAAVLAERDRLNAQLRAAKDTAEAAEDRVRDSEGRYRLLAEHTSDVIVLRGADIKTEYVSPSITALLGYSPEEFTALDVRELVHPEDLPKLRKLVRAMTPNRPHATSVHRLKSESGTYVWVEVAFNSVRDAESDDDRPKLLAVARDVSERQEQAAQVEAARRAAEEALKVKSEFLAMMSHELRTPLNSIIGFSDLIIEGGELVSEDGQRYARNVQNASRTLLSIVNDVMDVSKLEAGAIELDLQPFSLRTLFDETASMVRPEAERKGLSLTADVDPRIPERLIGDDSRLRQVLLNLLSNALKFTPKGLVAMRAIWEHGDATYARMRIIVADTGIGIPDDKRHRLFKRFSQVDQTTSRRYGGAGLGLSISKNLLDLMGSTIVVRSQPNAGSEFDFDLRLTVAPPAIGDEKIAAETTVQLPARTAVLVAEDVMLNQELLAALLGRWGCDVDMVADGKAAVAAATKKAYDIVLMDVQMPGMDGVEATKLIRAAAAPARDVPIVALTANVLPDEVARFRAAGMNGHIGKPFVPDELKAAIDTHRRPAPASSEPRLAAPADSFSAATLDDLRGLVGDEVVGTFLTRLETQLSGAFHTPPLGPAELSTLRYEAHALASTCGMLGFRRLSLACVALETAIVAEGSSVATVVRPLADALTARDQAKFVLDGLIDGQEKRAAG